MKKLKWLKAVCPICGKDDFERGMRVQIWDRKDKKNPVFLGIGTVIEIAYPVTNPEKKTIFVYSTKIRKVFFGDRYDFIPEKKAIEIANRIYKDVFSEKKKKE